MFFLHMKDEQDEVLVDWFNELNSKYCVNIKYICCDNAWGKGPTATLKRKMGQRSNSSLQPQTCPNRMVLWNVYSLG